MLYCEESFFPGHKCKDNLSTLVQKVDNDAGMQNQQDEQNQDHAIQLPFNVFLDNIYSYNNQDTRPNSLDILVGQDIPNIVRINGMKRLVCVWFSFYLKLTFC